MQRRIARVVLNIDVACRSQKNLYDLRMAFLGREVQGQAAASIATMHISTVVRQPDHRASIAVPGRNVKWRAPATVTTITLGATCNQQIHQVRSLYTHDDMKRPPAVRIVHVRRNPLGEQFLNNQRHHKPARHMDRRFTITSNLTCIGNAILQKAQDILFRTAGNCIDQPSHSTSQVSQHDESSSFTP